MQRLNIHLDRILDIHCRQLSYKRAKAWRGFCTYINNVCMCMCSHTYRHTNWQTLKEFDINRYICYYIYIYLLTCSDLDRRTDTHAHATNSFRFAPPIAVGTIAGASCRRMSISPNLINHRVIATIHFVWDVKSLGVYMCLCVCVVVICITNCVMRHDITCALAVWRVNEQLYFVNLTNDDAQNVIVYAITIILICCNEFYAR